MQYIEQFVKLRQEIKSLRTAVSYFFTFQKNIYSVSVIIFALQKTVHVDTRFSTDTVDLLVLCEHILLSGHLLHLKKPDE